MNTLSTSQNSGPVRRGVVAVVCRQERLLVIRRSAHVVAPGAHCFPGGGIEPGETEMDALRRELQEELGVQATAVQRLWESRTAWNVELAWWLADLSESSQLVPNPAEVETAQWLTLEEIRHLPNLLSSNHEFLAACDRGEIILTIPGRHISD